MPVILVESLNTYINYKLVVYLNYKLKLHENADIELARISRAPVCDVTMTFLMSTATSTRRLQRERAVGVGLVL